MDDAKYLMPEQLEWLSFFNVSFRVIGGECIIIIHFGSDELACIAAKQFADRGKK